MIPRQFRVGQHDAGKDLDSWLNFHLHLPARDRRHLLHAGLVHVDGKPCVDPGRRLRRGQCVEVRSASPKAGTRNKTSRRSATKAPSLAPSAVVFADEHIVVIDKPAGLTTMRHASDLAEFGKRARRFLPPTVADLLPSLLAKREGGAPRPLRAVHRLDKETSGLVVFARTPAAESHLGNQFRAHTVERVYQAIVRGHAVDARIESRLVDNRGDGRRGSTTQSDMGQLAVTHVRVVDALGNYTRVECRLETGRTHQVRIHLGEAGTPLCGERIYDRPLHGRPLPDGSKFQRIALHAAVLGLEHPQTGLRLRWSAPLPDDLQKLLNRLRRTVAGEPEP